MDTNRTRWRELKRALVGGGERRYKIKEMGIPRELFLAYGIHTDE